MRFVIRVIINAIALWVTAWLLSGPINIQGSLWTFLLLGVVFGVVNAVIRPVVRLFSLPLTCITLGLFTFVINALMLLLTFWLFDFFAGSKVVSISGNWFQQLLWAIVASIIISIVSGVLSWVLPDHKDK